MTDLAGRGWEREEERKRVGDIGGKREEERREMKISSAVRQEYASLLLFH